MPSIQVEMELAKKGTVRASLDHVCLASDAIRPKWFLKTSKLSGLAQHLSLTLRCSAQGTSCTDPQGRWAEGEPGSLIAAPSLSSQTQLCICQVREISHVLELEILV